MEENINIVLSDEILITPVENDDIIVEPSDNTEVIIDTISGPKGDTGERGPAGPQGIQGERGPAGPQGIQGERGPAGPQGVKGDTGDTGPQGSQGERGPAGPQGERGETGLTGPAGESATITIGTVTTGQAGSNASVTNVGTSTDAIFNFTIPQGVKGDTGDTGPQGSQGERGPTGPQGSQGERGPAGPQGEQGETGLTGPAGASATITIGSVTTGQAGSNASVTNVGTSTDAIFNFTIPQGVKGDTGDTGPQGPAGVIDWTDFTQGVPTKASNSIGNLNIHNYYIKFGRLVLAFINFQATASISASTTILTGFPVPIERAVFALADASNRGMRGRIMEGTGYLQCENTISSGYYNGSVAYWTAS